MAVVSGSGGTADTAHNREEVIMQVVEMTLQRRSVRGGGGHGAARGGGKCGCLGVEAVAASTVGSYMVLPL